MAMQTSGAYHLGDAEWERQRLEMQAAFFRPATQQLLTDAGIGAGMRVLEPGCGTGDVTLQLAERVGPTGGVVAIDRSPEMLNATRQRAAERGLPWVEVAEADVNALDLGGAFDALVGRLVLLHQPKPAATLRQLAAHVRPGGVVAFLEFHFFPATSDPPRPLYTEAYGWFMGAFERAGIHSDMGFALCRAFREAGLTEPTVTLQPMIGCGDEPRLPAMLAGIIRTVMPLIARFELASADAIDIETLEARLVDEGRRIGGAALGPVIGTAWARV